MQKPWIQRIVQPRHSAGAPSESGSRAQPHLIDDIQPRRSLADASGCIKLSGNAKFDVRCTPKAQLQNPSVGRGLATRSEQGSLRPWHEPKLSCLASLPPVR